MNCIATDFGSMEKCAKEGCVGCASFIESILEPYEQPDDDSLDYEDVGPNLEIDDFEANSYQRFQEKISMYRREY